MLATRNRSSIERAERLDVAAHRPQVAVRIGRHAVGQRLDRGPQRAERRAQVVADAGEHAPPLVLEPGPLPLEHVEPFGQLVEGAGDVAELVGPLDTGARRRDPPPRAGAPRDSRRWASRPSGRDATAASTAAKPAVAASTPSAERAWSASSTISRASTTAATAPMAIDDSVMASTSWRSDVVREVRARNASPAPTAQAASTTTATTVASGRSLIASHDAEAHGSNR